VGFYFVSAEETKLTVRYHRYCYPYHV